MHETTSYEIVGGEVEDEVKDEEKQIDVTGVEVMLDERRPELPPPPGNIGVNRCANGVQ